MAQLAVGALNALNEKGLRYKAEVNDGKMAFKFGMLAGGKKNVVLVTPQDEAIAVTGLGNDKALDVAGFEAFVDKILEVKKVQEQLAGLEEELKA